MNIIPEQLLFSAVRSFQEESFVTRAKFILPGDWRPGLGTPVNQGTRRNTGETYEVLMSPQNKEWAESLKKQMKSMHSPGACDKETGLPGKHRAQAVCALQENMFLSTRKKLSQ